jgi:hypothetical protein
LESNYYYTTFVHKSAAKTQISRIFSRPCVKEGGLINIFKIMLATHFSFIYVVEQHENFPLLCNQWNYEQSVAHLHLSFVVAVAALDFLYYSAGK